MLIIGFSFPLIGQWISANVPANLDRKPKLTVETKKEPLGIRSKAWTLNDRTIAEEITDAHAHTCCSTILNVVVFNKKLRQCKMNKNATLEWCGTDLNPIENLWHCMKNIIAINNQPISRFLKMLSRVSWRLGYQQNIIRVSERVCLVLKSYKIIVYIEIHRINCF